MNPPNRDLETARLPFATDRDPLTGMVGCGIQWLFLAIPKINTKRLLARNMLAEGLEPATVAKISGLTEGEILAIMRDVPSRRR